MNTWAIIRTILEITYAVVVLGIVIKVISQNRNPLKTTSWILFLVLVPFFGLFCYYFFGQDARQIRIISNKKYKLLKKRSSTQPAILPDDSAGRTEYHALAHLLNHNHEAALLQGSLIDVYTNGKPKFDALIEDLSQAKHHIHLQYYIFNDDEIGHKIRSLLIDKVREGIAVRVLYDDVANWKVKNRFYKEMAAEGIELTAFLKVHFPVFTSKVNYRNHRKVLVIDGKIGYLGGMNIADRYLSSHWRDTHIRIDGRGVLGMQSAFLIDWYSSGKELITGLEYFPPLSIKSDNLMQIVAGGPISQWRTLLQATIQIIANSKDYVFIQTPYFMPEESLAQTLQFAALSGTDVRLMVPEKADTRFVTSASRSYYEAMLRAGVKIYIYKDAFLHAKMIVADDFLTVLGSANMDFRSFEHNFEINSYIYDPKFALQMKNVFFEDQRCCNQIILNAWNKRPAIRKFQESILRLFSPLF
jgi:Phosphatidylserine/phosphatidylglycerophosphate/cardiolipin synthases and related enzymes